MRSTFAAPFISLAIFFQSIELSSQARRFEFPKHVALEDIPDLIMPRGYPKSFQGAFIGSDYKGQILPFTRFRQIVIVREPFNIVEPISEQKWLEMREEYYEHVKGSRADTILNYKDLPSASVRRQIRVSPHHVNADNERQQALLMNHEDLRRLSRTNSARIDPVSRENTHEIIPPSPGKLTRWSSSRLVSRISSMRISPAIPENEPVIDTPRPPRLNRWPIRPASK